MKEKEFDFAKISQTLLWFFNKLFSPDLFGKKDPTVDEMKERLREAFDTLESLRVGDTESYNFVAQNSLFPLETDVDNMRIYLEAIGEETGEMSDKRIKALYRETYFYYGQCLVRTKTGSYEIEIPPLIPGKSRPKR